MDLQNVSFQKESSLVKGFAAFPCWLDGWKLGSMVDWGTLNKFLSSAKTLDGSQAEVGRPGIGDGSVVQPM